MRVLLVTSDREQCGIRLATKIKVVDGHWLWVGGSWCHGYPYFHHAGQNRRAHRFVYEFHRGPIPRGLVLDHRCKYKKRCVNPDCLVPCTQRENNARSTSPSARYGRLTRCRRGLHKLSGTNVRMKPLRGGFVRVCRVCESASRHSRYMELGV